MRKRVSEAMEERLGITHKRYYAEHGPTPSREESGFYPPVWGLEFFKGGKSVGFVMSAPRAHFGDGRHHVRRTATGKSLGSARTQREAVSLFLKLAYGL